MGKAIEECCELATERELQAVRDLKHERFGPPPIAVARMETIVDEEARGGDGGGGRAK